MDQIKAYFPFSFDTKDVKTLIIKIVVYVVLEVLVGLVGRIISIIPIAGPIVSWALGILVGLYAIVGIVLAVLDYMKVLK